MWEWLTHPIIAGVTFFVVANVPLWIWLGRTRRGSPRRPLTCLCASQLWT